MGRKRKSVTLAERGSAKLAKVSTDTDEHARSHSTAPTTVVQHEGRDASLKPSSTVDLVSKVKRRRKSPIKSYHDHRAASLLEDTKLQDRFTISEKEKLLAALKRHGPEDHELLAKSVPTRSADEIRWFLDRMQKNAKAPRSSSGSKKSPAPIEQWLAAATNLTRNKVDYSYMLSHVVAIAGNFEPRTQRKQVVSPNYASIYGYITQLLEGTFPNVAQLQPIDCVIILDLLQGLADHLKSLDLENQSKLMLLKYKLLNTKINAKNASEAYKAVAKAFQDDLLESEGSQSHFTEMSPIKRPVTSTCTTATLSSQAETDSEVRPSTSTHDAANEDPSEDHINDRQENSDISQPTEQSSESIPKTVQTAKRRDARKVVRDNRTGSPTRSNRWPVIEAKKSKLYTLNPFAISVKYLRPQKKDTSPRNIGSEIPPSSSTSKSNSGNQ